MLDIRILLAAILVGTGFVPEKVSANEMVDEAVVAKILEESSQRSEVGRTLSYLSDVYGPRLSGTARYLDMVNWVESQLRMWGIENVRTETFGDGLRGWEVTSQSAAITAPSFMMLNAYAVCCSKSTDGAITAPVAILDFYDTDVLEANKGQLSGRILVLPELTSEYDGVSGAWSARKLEQAANRTDAVTPDGLDGPGSTISYLDRLRQGSADDDQSDRKLAQFLLDEGVAALVRSSSSPAGIVNNRFESGFVEFHRAGDPKPVPLFVIPREQHARLLALHKLGSNPELTLNLSTRYFEDEKFHVNLLADIPGTDPQLQEEFVYLGAHLDSVELGTGAADNGVGAATAIEVLRMIKALHLKPRRTIRIALWGGEEQGLLGSSAYVKRHLGDLVGGDFSPHHGKISAYFNHDNNGHDIRGIFLVGHETIRPIFQAFLDPFEELAASTVTIENAGGTDILVFDAAGIPSFEWIHDPQNYFSHQLHSNLDTPAMVNIESVKRNAAIIASVVYHTAMRDEKLPRK